MSEGKMAVLGLFVLALISPCFCDKDSIIVSYDVTKPPMPPVELSCTEAADAVALKWVLDGTDITTRKEWVKDFAVFEGNKTLRLLKVGPTTVGVYICRYPNDTNVMTFDVKSIPYITPFPETRNIIQGDPLNLECHAWGIPAPVITWVCNGTIKLTPDASGKIILKNNTASQSAKFPVLENNTLRIEPMEYEDHGMYTCFATVMINGEKYETNSTVTVHIKSKYAALWPFLGICVEVSILCAIIIIYEKRRAKRIAEEERQEEAERLNVPTDTKTPANDDVRQRK